MGLRFSLCDLCDKAGVLKEISVCKESDPLPTETQDLSEFAETRYSSVLTNKCSFHIH